MAKDDEGIERRQLDRIVVRLRAVVFGGQVATVAQAGEIILDEIFGGDVEAARDRSSSKEESMRQLADRAEEFGMTATGVRRAVPIALQVRQLGKTIGMQLGVSHHLALMPLRNPREKKVIAEVAVKEALSAEKIRDKVRELQPAREGGRNPSPPAKLLADRAHRVFDATLVKNMDDRVGELGMKELKRLLGAVNAVSQEVQKLQRVLVKAVTHAAAVEAEKGGD